MCGSFSKWRNWSFSFRDFLCLNVPDVLLWFPFTWLFWNCKPVCRYHLSLLNNSKANQTYLLAFSNTNIFYQKSKVEVVVPQKITNIGSRLFGLVLFVIGVFIETCCEQGTGKKSLCRLSFLEQRGTSPARHLCLCLLRPCFSSHACLAIF